MNRKLKIFLKVLYYFSTFSLGLFLALYLPNVLYYSETMSTIRTSLSNDQYDKAMIYIGGYFNSENVFVQKFDQDSGIVLFESVTITKNPNATDASKYILQDSYSGFLYNVKGKYVVEKLDNNKTELIAVDSNDAEVHFTILDRDKNADGKMDSHNTLDEYGFIFIDLPKSKIASIKTLKFVDCGGALYKSFDLSTKTLDYNSQFFTDVHVFTNVFNEDNKASNITTLDQEFRAKNAHYTYSNYGSGNANVTAKAIWIIIAYFAVVYLIADCGLGKRYLIHGVRWLIYKIFKIKPKPKKEKTTTYSSDYYSQLTIALDLSNLTEEELKDFPEEVEIKYNNETEFIDFKLTKEEEYKHTDRIKAGVYTNMKTSLSKDDYYFSGVAYNLKVSSFKTNVLIIVRKKR